MLAYSDFIPIFASHYQGNSFNLNNYIMTKVTINQPEFNQYILDLYESKGLKPFDYQIDFLTNTRFRTTEKTIVLAGGTSSGKTIMSLAWLESQDLEGTINVIIPSATKVLRDNFEDSIFGFQPSFNYRVVVDGQDLRRAIKDKVEVIICLPQTLGRNLDLLPKINNLVVDEAHLWATAPTVQSIIETCKPTRQLFLTGTPFQFNGQSDKYEIKHVSVQTLLQLGKVTNTAIKVVSSTYTMNNDDYNQTGDVKESTILSSGNSETSLKRVCKEMIQSLKSMASEKDAVSEFGDDSIGPLFNHLDKTIIFVRSKDMADKFTEILSSEIGLKGKVLCSHSDNDGESIEFKRFQKDSSIRILVAVNRGRLGFDMSELFNVVDFTITQSTEQILQMVGRLLRLSKKNPNKAKIFFKVAPENLVSYYIDVMSLCVRLTEEEWYSKFNGTNFQEIPLPILARVSEVDGSQVVQQPINEEVVEGGFTQQFIGSEGTTLELAPSEVVQSEVVEVETTEPTQRTQTQASGTRQPSTFRRYTISDMPDELDLNIFTRIESGSLSNEFKVVAETTIGELRRTAFGIEGTCKPVRKEELLERAVNAKGLTCVENEKTFKRKCINSGNYYGYDGLAWFDYLITLIPNNRGTRWTDDVIKSACLESTSAKDMRSKPKGNSAYQTLHAKYSHKIDEWTSHWDKPRKPYTKEEVIEAVKSVISSKELIDTHGSGLYGVFRKTFTKEEVKLYTSHWKPLHQTNKLICMLDKETGAKLMTFDSSTKAVEYLVSKGVSNAKAPTINSTARGDKKSIYGYKWQYA